MLLLFHSLVSHPGSEKNCSKLWLLFSKWCWYKRGKEILWGNSKPNITSRWDLTPAARWKLVGSFPSVCESYAFPSSSYVLFFIKENPNLHHWECDNSFDACSSLRVWRNQKFGEIQSSQENAVQIIITMRSSWAVNLLSFPRSQPHDILTSWSRLDWKFPFIIPPQTGPLILAILAILFTVQGHKHVGRNRERGECCVFHAAASSMS